MALQRYQISAQLRVKLSRSRSAMSNFYGQGHSLRLDGTPLGIEHQLRTQNTAVITDHACSLGGEIKILLEDMSPKAFDKFIGDSMKEIESNESGTIVNLCNELKPTTVTYDGYKAILAKVRVLPPLAISCLTHLYS
jgi:hypothetical protein